MELGREAAEYVSKTFVKPIKLEFEKVRPARLARLRMAPVAAQHASMLCLLSAVSESVCSRHAS